VLGDETLDPRRVAGHGGGGDALVAVGERVVGAGEQRVAGGGDDRPVEAAVGLRETGAGGGQRALLRGDRLLEQGRELLAGLGGAARAVALDQLPRLVHVVGLGGRDRDHERPAARVELDEPLGLELPEGLAQRRPADSELAGQRVLAQERAAGEAAIQQPFLDVRVGALRRALDSRSIRTGRRDDGHG
jgi:hypothetical protein